MPIVTVAPQILDTDEIIRTFTDSVGTSPVTYTYPTTQKKITITNNGTSHLILQIDIQYTIPPGQSRIILTEIREFTIQSTNGIQSFQAVSDEVEYEADSPLEQNILNKVGSLSKKTGDGYNLNDGLRKFRNALADIDNNPVKIACIGDSISFGAYASDVNQTNWVSRLRAILQSKLGNVGLGNYPIPDPNYPTKTLWTTTGTWTMVSNKGGFGRQINANGTDKTLTLNFTGTDLTPLYTK
jgi:hypothetical protein